MTILFICDEYPPGKNGGIGTVVQVLGRELVKQGHRVIVAGLYRYRYGGKDFEIDQGVEVWRKRFGLNLNLHENHRLYNLLEKSPASIRRNLNGKKAFKKFISFIENVIEKEGVEVIEIPDWNNFAFFIGFTIKWPNFKAPLVLKSHGSYTYFNSELKIPLTKLLKDTDIQLYKRANAYSSVSAYTAEINRKLFGIKEQIKILPNSIEVKEFNSDVLKAEQTVIYTGTLIQKKGIFQLIKAWNLVHKKLPSAELHVYGKGNVKALIQLLDAEALNSVKIKGHVNRSHLFNELRKASLAVFPSYSETFGLMCIEAMSVACPVIYTKRSCGPEIIQDKENGVLVDPDNVEEIATNIINLIENKDLQEKYSKNGRATVLTKFNINNSATEHIHYYEEVINQFKQLHSK
jgi:glycosyltransferase involved in cell wall biosynthesis